MGNLPTSPAGRRVPMEKSNLASKCPAVEVEKHQPPFDLEAWTHALEVVKRRPPFGLEVFSLALAFDPETMARSLAAEEVEVEEEGPAFDPKEARARSRDADEVEEGGRTEGSSHRPPLFPPPPAGRRVGVAMGRSKLVTKYHLKKRLTKHRRPFDWEALARSLATEVEKLLRMKDLEKARAHTLGAKEVEKQPSGFGPHGMFDEYLQDLKARTFVKTDGPQPLPADFEEGPCIITKVHEGWRTMLLPTPGEPYDPAAYGAEEVHKGVWELKDQPVDLDAIGEQLKENPCFFEAVKEAEAKAKARTPAFGSFLP